MGKNQACYFIVMKVLCCSTVSREWLCTPELVSGDGNGSSRGHLSSLSLTCWADHFSLTCWADHFCLYLLGDHLSLYFLGDHLSLYFLGDLLSLYFLG